MLATYLRWKGFDAIHTTHFPEGHLLQNAAISRVFIDEKREDSILLLKVTVAKLAPKNHHESVHFLSYVEVIYLFADLSICEGAVSFDLRSLQCHLHCL